MNKKILALVGIVTVALLVGWVVWYFKKQKIQEVLIQSSRQESTVASDDIDTSDWKTYRNEEYGIEFKYPEDIFYVQQISDSSNALMINIIQSGRTGVAVDDLGKMEISLNSLIGEKDLMLMQDGKCFEVIVGGRTGEVCSDKLIADEVRETFDSFEHGESCSGDFGVVFFKIGNALASKERKDLIYISCDIDNPVIMKYMREVYRSMKFL